MDSSGDLALQIQAMRDFVTSGATFSRTFRQAVLDRLYACVKRREADLAAALKADLGKAPGEAYLTEIGPILSEVAFLRRHLRALMRPRRARTPPALFPARSRIYAEPLGVCLVMAPWNYPAHLALIPLAAAVAAGNCAALKPSSRAPATAALLADMAAECFAPEHVYVAQGQGATTGAALLAEPWDFIFYTGSARIGREVAAAAARRLTPVCLELGGKCPAIVAADANIDKAARRIAWGKLLNAGQTCVAPDYVLAERPIKDRLAAALRAEFTRFPGRGRAALANPDYGRIISAEALARLEKLSGGAAACDRESLRLAPLVMDEAGPEHPVMAEEIFGPLLPVLSVVDLDAAAEFVRARAKPLACYIFTGSRAAAEDLLGRIPCGGACVNDVVMHLASPYLPFGGVGASGMGRYHGRAGFELFSNLKSVAWRGTRPDLPWRYLPVGERALRILRRIIK